MALLNFKANHRKTLVADTPNGWTGLDLLATERAVARFSRPDQVFSLPYNENREDSRLRYWQYRFMEATGLSTF